MAITTTITPIEDKTLNAMQYIQQAQGNALAGVDANLNASLAGFQNQQTDINKQYDDVARQAYANYQTGQKGLANQLASSGLYNTGYADTLRVAAANQYASNISAAENERAKALRDLEAQRTQLQQQANADKLNIYAQYGQMMADQSNADRDYTFQQQQYADNRADVEWNRLQAEKEYADSRADVEWEREQYLKENETAAKQQAISNAYAAAELGDFSQLEALGIDTTAAKRAWEANERARLLEEAYAAAELGNFAPLKALGYDTTDLEKLWAADVYSSLNSAYRSNGGGYGGTSSTTKETETTKKDYGEFTGSEYNDAITQADRLVENFRKQGKSYKDVETYVNSIEWGTVKQKGEDWFATYKDRVLNAYPVYEPKTVDSFISDFTALNINSRSEALEYAYEFSGTDRENAMTAVNKEFPRD